MQAVKSKIRYPIELGSAMIAYAIVLVAALQWGAALHEGPLKTAVMIAPMLPIMLAVWAIFRQVRRVDEFIRKSTLENICVAAAVTAVWTMTYGFLENAGFPRLSMFAIWPAMGAAWAVTAIVRNRCEW